MANELRRIRGPLEVLGPRASARVIGWAAWDLLLLLAGIMTLRQFPAWSLLWWLGCSAIVVFVLRYVSLRLYYMADLLQDREINVYQSVIADTIGEKLGVRGAPLPVVLLRVIDHFHAPRPRRGIPATSEAEKLATLEAWEEERGNTNQTTFCKRRGISVATLGNWRRELQAAGKWPPVDTGEAATN